MITIPVRRLLAEMFGYQPEGFEVARLACPFCWRDRDDQVDLEKAEVSEIKAWAKRHDACEPGRWRRSVAK